jgi:thiamine biosynthesis lipoprotein
MKTVPALVALACLVGPHVASVRAERPPALPAPTTAVYHYDGVLGTSADFTFVAPSAPTAERAQRVARAEIERLRLLLSSWDDASELSQLFVTGRLDHPSAELVTVLEQYAAWHERSAHAYSARIGELSSLWRSAAATGVLPAEGELARTVEQIAAPAWRMEHGRVIALTTHRVDLNSLGKGFIIDRALQAVREQVPEVRGALINIGGDIHVWGTAPRGGAWSIAVADPVRHADNAAPLTQLALSGGAVSSSGDYERGFTIGGTHYSHILDPRTGHPVDHIIGATVVAADNATANALATTLSVLTPTQGLALVRATPGAEAMLVSADGTVRRSAGFARLEQPLPTRNTAAAAITAKLAIDVTPTVANRHQPFVAVWVTDSVGKHVRTVAFWGDKPKYLHEMSKWWSLNKGDQPLIDAVTRATRPVGKYTLEWDGLDQKGGAVPAGSYTFWLEVGFEDGAHSAKSVTVTCGKGPATGTIPSAAAFTGADVSCEPAKK